MLTSRVVLLVLLTAVHVLTDRSPCPSDQCRCEDGTPERGRIINCRARGISQVPTFQASNELFYELTLANTVGCSNCNNITVIPRNAFTGLKVQRIDLSRNRVEYVSPEAFTSLVPALTEISIEGSRRYPPPYRALSVVTNLRTLTLKNFNQLYMSRSNTYLDTLVNLEELVLKDMEISHIRENVFKNRLPKLKILKLEFLPLGSLPVSGLRYLKKLEVLRAVHIEITEIPYRAFSSFQNLKELDLSHNEIARMKPGCFDGIEDSLEYLGLHLNKLNEVSVGPLAAVRWTNLKQLNIGHNSMQSVPIGLFFNMKKVEYLNLDSNELTSVESGTFQGLQALQFLDLSYNKLSSLSSGAFLHTPSLTKLDIRGEDTQIFNISTQGIRGLENTLEDLILTDTVVFEEEMWRAVSSLNELRVLQLGGTKLTDIPDYQFVNNRKLVSLMLDRNGIRELTQKTFHGLDTLETLNLQGNAITTINKCVLNSLANLEMLYLGKNPLSCDCNLVALRNWIVTRIQKNYIVQYMVDAMCRAPAAFNGLAVWDLQENQLTCVSGHVMTECELLPDNIPTSEMPTTNLIPGADQSEDEQAFFSFKKIVETGNTIEIDWSFYDDRLVAGTKLEYQLLGQSSESRLIDLSPSLKNYVISGLRSDSNYLICLGVRPRNPRLLRSKPRKVCVAVKTLP